MEWWSFVRNAGPFATLMAAECTDIGMTTLAKAAMIKGMSNFAFVVYANALGALILLPIVLTRRKRAPLTISILCKFFIPSLLGSVAQMLESTSVKYSSPTLSSAMSNLNPIFTYELAISFRMEELDLRSSSGVAKFLGALVSVLGAFIITLYKGQKILLTSPFAESPHQLLQSQQSNWVLVGLLLAIAFLSFALSNIFQTAVVREIPEKTTIVFFLCFFATILCGSFSLIVERNLNAWKLRPGIELIAVVYAAILGCVVHGSVTTWCLQEKGPVFVAMFKPVGIAIAVVMSSLFVGDPLYLGSVIGAVIIALGFYTVMWGKAKEQKLVPENEISCFELSSERTPLLRNKLKEEMSLAQILESTGVKYGSPTLSSAMSNLIPVFTYVLAILFRMEELDLTSSSGVAKLLGALVSVLGAFIVTLYKGRKILPTSPIPESHHQLLHSQQSNWVLAGLLLAIASLSFASSSIIQTPVVRELPGKTTIVFFLCFFRTIRSESFSLIVERNPHAWKLRPDTELIAIIYSGIFICVVRTGVSTWCLQEKGPVFVAMFKPLGIAIAVVMATIFLRDPLILAGAVIIALGFYTVMWGKAKEQKLVPENEISCFESSSERTPLLQNKPKEEM